MTEIERAIEQIHIMQAAYSHIRRNDAEWEALCLAEDALREKAERDKGCAVLNEDAVISAVKKAILVNSDEKKYRYELGKDCLIPCCKDAYKYLLQQPEEDKS